MANHIRVQGIGASKARVVSVAEHIVHIVDGTTRLLLLGLQPGDSLHRGLVAYESADCRTCSGEGEYQHGDRNVECRDCGGMGVHDECRCGNQMEYGCDACEACVAGAEAEGEWAYNNRDRAMGGL